MTSPTMTAREWLLLVVLSLLWGGSFFFVEVALIGLPPLTIVFLRVFLAALALLGLVYATGRRMPADPKVWGAFFFMGGLNNAIPFTLIVWGQVHITSGLVSILNATTPLFTVLLAHVLTRDERLTASRLAGVAVGFVGVIVLIGPAMLGGLGAHALAQVAILGAALAYAFAGIFGRRFRALPSSVVAAGMLTGSSALILPLALAVDRPWTLRPDGVTVSAVVALALLSTALAYIIYFRILAVAGATNLLLVTFLIPPSALLLGVLVLGEALEPRALAGMLLIFAGLAFVDGRLPRLLLRRAQTIPR